MPADVLLPARAPDVARCPNVGLGPLANVLPWTRTPSAALQAWARAQLVHPLGTIIRDVVDGAPVVARIECHFAYGADPSIPGHWHKGTSVYHAAERSGPGGALVALVVPPPDWPSSAT